MKPREELAHDYLCAMTASTWNPPREKAVLNAFLLADAFLAACPPEPAASRGPLFSAAEAASGTLAPATVARLFAEPAAEPQGAAPTGGVRCWATSSAAGRFAFFLNVEPVYFDEDGDGAWFSECGSVACGPPRAFRPLSALLGDKRGPEAIIECRIVPVSEQARPLPERPEIIDDIVREAEYGMSEVSAHDCREIINYIEALEKRAEGQR